VTTAVWHFNTVQVCTAHKQTHFFEPDTHNIFLLLGTTAILSDVKTVDVLHQQINLPSHCNTAFCSPLVLIYVTHLRNHSITTVTSMASYVCLEVQHVHVNHILLFQELMFRCVAVHRFSPFDLCVCHTSFDILYISGCSN